ncbi:cell division protein ZapA [Propylenella binzhouense]|uniref:Cell division protein ZapA n=1 Tax=Propylenella binzhouense TaxID=2555902 RepID=A0A964WTS0_9HYPH|nr:cell division protein ZapA [Propylenella binzhouense]MYZ48110.1 cell division protein ZapA [Propylenella binzhouense]
MAQVMVTVNGRTYRMACEEGQEDHLLRLGERFDQTISELKDALGEVGDQRLMVMAGILMTDRLQETEERLEAAEAELRRLRSERQDIATHYEDVEAGLIDSLESAAARIEELARRLRAERGSDEPA